MPTYANLKNRRYYNTSAAQGKPKNARCIGENLYAQEIVPWPRVITTVKYESCTSQLERWDSTVAIIATYCCTLLYTKYIIGILIVTMVSKSLAQIAIKWHEM